MPPDIAALICQATGAVQAEPRQVVQRLWSGYGRIVRYRLHGADRAGVVVKHVKPPRIGHGDLSHRRKLRSYQVETIWYSDWSSRCDSACRVPASLASAAFGDEVVLILEDLDAAGFGRRRSRIAEDDLSACLAWLANFHATFLGDKPEGLWPTGTYWHLATRPDELQALNDPPLQQAAAAIDRALSASPFQTLVHGDAKLDNFCFAERAGPVAAVDFQYVGGGPGIKDVAYFIDSCVPLPECERRESELLAIYFAALRRALSVKRPDIDADALERDWRALYPLAWTDFHRFLKGWSPGHWPSDSYSERLARQVIAQLTEIRCDSAT
ncbi:choline kinase [Methylomonas sp. LWB]|uniref:phosphotransferase n=1 Tax=Methylomonas sp. LWB TaxID=1905845 RepID=UPI0008DB1AA1|nr:phosphotransferase [Methylomonas sp. LWB]OHX34262.1 choline kinase [Methylomonas sp. LWB]